MPTRQIDLPFIYKNYGKAPRKRTSSVYDVTTFGRFDIHDAADDEFPHVLDFVYTSRKADGTEHETWTTPFREFDGRYFRRMSGLNVDSFAFQGGWDPLRPEIVNLHETLRVPAFSTRYSHPTEVYGKSMIRPHHVERDGEAEAKQALSAHVWNNVVASGGDLYYDSPDPVWRIWINDDGVRVDAVMSHTSSHFSFPADCEAEAEIFAMETAKALGLPYRRDTEVRFDIKTTSLPHRSNPVVLAALDIASRCDLNVSNYAPFGDETKVAGLRLRLDPTARNALDFIDVLEEALPSYRNNLHNERLSISVVAFKLFLDHVPDKFLPLDARFPDLTSVGPIEARR